MGVGECGPTDRGTQAPWVNRAPSRIHPGVHTAGRGPATQGLVTPQVCGRDLSPWVGGERELRPGWRWGQAAGSPCFLGSGPAGASQPGHLQGLSSLLLPGSAQSFMPPAAFPRCTRRHTQGFPSPFAAARGAQCPASFPPGVGLLALVHTAGKRKWAQDPRAPSPSCPEPSSRGYQALLAFLGFSALCSLLAVGTTLQRPPQDPIPRSRNSFLLAGAPVGPGPSWGGHSPRPLPPLSLSVSALLKGLLQMTPSVSWYHV